MKYATLVIYLVSLGFVPTFESEDAIVLNKIGDIKIEFNSVTGVGRVHDCGFVRSFSTWGELHAAM
jgi:hypothetical protein